MQKPASCASLEASTAVSFVSGTSALALSAQNVSYTPSCPGRARTQYARHLLPSGAACTVRKPSFTPASAYKDEDLGGAPREDRRKRTMDAAGGEAEQKRRLAEAGGGDPRPAGGWNPTEKNNSYCRSSP